MSRRNLLLCFLGLWIILIVYTYLYFINPILHKRKVARVAPVEVPLHPGQPWYMRGGTLRPGKSVNTSRLFPEDRGPVDDGIHEQLMLGGPEQGEGVGGPEREEGAVKKILLREHWEGIELGREIFIQQGCPVSQCSISRDVEADLVILKDMLWTTRSPLPFPRGKNQLWMMYSLESPKANKVEASNMFNWTASYRRDSTIVTPYGKWRYYDPQVKSIKQDKNFASGKTKAVAWMVSNCVTPNFRLEYAKELAKYIQVDIYGSCGNLTCPRQESIKLEDDPCHKMLRDDYKFYLAFENANCRDYITEKFFVNALANDIIPVVMGARMEDYAVVAPEHSYIHVDEFVEPKDLANFLHQLDGQDQLYNNFFQWKGTGEFIDTRFFCRLCSMLHSGPEREKNHYDNIKDWWSGNGVCSHKTWERKFLPGNS